MNLLIYFMREVSINIPASEVKRLRVKSGYTQKQMAEHMGYSHSGWVRKESDGKSNRKLSAGEYNYMLLLAGEHPYFKLTGR